MINIAFFEDHPIVAKSLVTLFTNEAATTLLFKAATKSELYAALDIYDATLDILIIDLLAIDVQGLEIFETVHKKHPQIKQIAFTSLTSPILVENLLAVGVKGYVNKNQEIEDLLAAIEKVKAGEIYLPTDYNFLLKRNTTPINSALSEREIEIMQFIIMEYTTNDIANQLNISVNTVENHRKSIFQKLDVKNVAGMVREASKLGYIN